MYKNIRLIYITVSDKAEAREIGRTLVEEHLTACVNIMDGMESIYRWEGEIQEDNECVLTAKTPYHNVDKLTERVKELHSYDCPCIISLQTAEQEGNEEYRQWLMDETQSKVINYEIE